MSTPRRSAVNWFEIPVRDLDRAQAFYEAMLGAPLKRKVIGSQTLAVWPYAEPGTGGALLLGSDVPAPGSGTLVYQNAGDALRPAVDRTVAVGAHLLTARVDLPDGMGTFVHLRDSQRNRIGLHAPA